MVAESAILVAIGTAMATVVVKTVLERSVDAVSQTSAAAGLKSAISGSLKPELENLERELSKFHALLGATESPNDLVLLWLRRVREAANFADNILDEISYDQMRRQVEKSTSRVARFFVGSDGSLKFRMKMGRKLNKFSSMTDEIYKEVAEMGLIPAELVANPSSNQPPPSMSTDLREIRENIDTSTVVGRQHDEKKIVCKLCRPDNDQVPGVIAIVGMSGVGKTTLARKIYDNKTVEKHYKEKTWIFVSNDFCLRRLLDEMLQSLTGNSHNLSNIDAMEKKLRKCLKKRRYLLVLDDVWSIHQIWSSIRSSLVRITDGCTGSMVLVTTQSHNVASVMGASLIYIVKELCDDDAWALFKHKAFANKNQEQASDLRAIGKKILEKCGGLPLAITTLGSLLGSMDERSEWESVERSELWNLSEGNTKIIPWLLLSFNHLPNASLKQCFAYCSVVIPKGGSVDEPTLINYWIAQGFIRQSETGYERTFGIGQKYIKDMLAIGLLQSYTSSDGVSFFSMHDLIHDLAFYVSKGTCLITRDPEDILRRASSGVEHVTIYCGNSPSSQLKFPDGNTQSTLRTLLCTHATVSVDLIVQARFLRLLQLNCCGLQEIPGSIGRLKHLRILELQDNPFKYLPDSIGRLYNLQNLDLQGCNMLIELPQTVTTLLNLRTLQTTKAVHIPKGMGQLKCLTQLPIVKLKAGDAHKIEELGSLPHLKGHVIIKKLENICCNQGAEKAGLKRKDGIKRLNLIWTSKTNKGINTCSHYESVMEGLQPHSNLEALQMKNFRGKRFSPWLSNGLHCANLTSLSLLDCTRCEQLPTLGALPCLQSLLIDGVSSVEVIGSDFFYTCDQREGASSSTGSSHSGTSESNFFPRLKAFKLLNMPKLEKWFAPSGSCASVFPCLEDLCIQHCPSLLSVPSCFYSLKQLTIEFVNCGEPLLMILSSSYNLISLRVKCIHQLARLSKPLLECTSLELLRIEGCKKLVELPPTLQSLLCLQTLEVKDCDSLASLPDIKGLLQLSCLYLQGCPKLKRIPDLASLGRLQTLSLSSFTKQISVPQCLNLLNNLSKLTIGGFNKRIDSFFGIDQLPKCLRSLTLQGWPKLKSLPNELQSMTQLVRLRLREFEKVEALPEWLGNLSSLRVLRIRNCKSMKHLPSFDTMRNLTKLRQLDIKECPLLEEICSKDGGKEWLKNSHLSGIWINGIRMTGCRECALLEPEIYSSVDLHVH